MFTLLALDVYVGWYVVQFYRRRQSLRCSTQGARIGVGSGFWLVGLLTNRPGAKQSEDDYGSPPYECEALLAVDYCGTLSPAESRVHSNLLEWGAGSGKHNGDIDTRRGDPQRGPH